MDRQVGRQQVQRDKQVDRKIAIQGGHVNREKWVGLKPMRQLGVLCLSVTFTVR